MVLIINLVIAIEKLASASELLQILKTCFFGTTQTVMLSKDFVLILRASDMLSTKSNVQSHTGVLPGKS